MQTDDEGCCLPYSDLWTGNVRCDILKDNEKGRNISCEGGTGLKKKLIQVAVVLVLIMIIMAGAGVSMLIERYKPTTEREDLYTYFNIEESNTEDVILFLQGEDLLPVRTEMVVKQLDGKLYLPYDMVAEECNARFYWDESVQMMVFTTAYDIYKYPLNILLIFNE